MAPSFEPHDPRALRDALGSFATGVTVVTAPAAGRDRPPVGMTVNSFSSLSLDPPLILWSIKRSNPNLARFGEGGHFGVNILADDQAPLCGYFAQPRAGLLDEMPFHEGIGGIPLLDQCCATFECVTQGLVEGGDHLLVIGRVLRFRNEPRGPLVFHGGRQWRIGMPAACT